jgi:hypothetical protein
LRAFVDLVSTGTTTVVVLQVYCARNR